MSVPTHEQLVAQVKLLVSEVAALSKRVQELEGVVSHVEDRVGTLRSEVQADKTPTRRTKVDRVIETTPEGKVVETTRVVNKEEERSKKKRFWEY